VRYHERELGGVDARLANPPTELPADYAEVLAAIEALAG
jgi:hypothetical protein